jgi:hypothetical protein
LSALDVPMVVWSPLALAIGFTPIQMLVDRPRKPRTACPPSEGKFLF